MLVRGIVGACAVTVVATGMIGGCTQASRPSETTDSATVGAADDAAAKARALTELKRDMLDWLKIPDPPEVTPVRWVRPEELQDLTDACLGTQGFPKQADGTMDTPPEKVAAFHLAQYTCALRYPALPRYAKAPGTAQKKIQYDWTVNYLIPCLKARGYDLETPVPSEATFVETWDSNPFRPFAELDQRYSEFGLTNATWDRLERDCAQNAPSAVMWDGMTVAEWAAAHPIRSSPAPAGS